jgi:hypothetical protein
MPAEGGRGVIAIEAIGPPDRFVGPLSPIPPAAPVTDVRPEEFGQPNR